MKAVALDMYPVRPAMQEGESLLGYLHRFFWANGHSVPAELRALAEAIRSRSCQTRQVNEFRRLMGCGSVDGSLALELTATKLVFVCSGNAAWRKWSVVGRHCPACASKGIAHQIVFDLPLIEACPVHDVLLVSGCSECGALLAWGSLLPGGHCRCGAFIGNMRRVPAAPWQGRLARWLAEMAKWDDSDPRKPLPNVYLMFEIALRIRYLLVGGGDAELNFLRHPRAPEHPRKIPGRWEATLVFEPFERAVVRARRLFRKAYQTDDCSLIVPIRNPRVDALFDLLKKSTRGTLAPLAKLHNAVEYVRRELTVVPEWTGVHFNPGIRASTRLALVAALGAWWRSARLHLVIAAPDVALRRSGYTFPEVVIGVINALVEVAVRGRPIETLRAFKAHWLPTQVFSAVDGSIESFGVALSGLHVAELVFLEALLRQDLEEDAGSD